MFTVSRVDSSILMSEKVQRVNLHTPFLEASVAHTVNSNQLVYRIMHVRVHCEKS